MTSSTNIHDKTYSVLTVYAVLSSKEPCRRKLAALRLGAACGSPADESVDDCDLVGGGGADRRVPLRLKPVGIDGAGRDGRIRPFSDVGVAGCCDCSEIIDKLSTFESSECTLTSSGYDLRFFKGFKRKLIKKN